MTPTIRRTSWWGVPLRTWGSAGNILVLTVLAAGVLLLRFSPPFVLWYGLEVPEAWSYPQVNRAVESLRLIDDPLNAQVTQTNEVIRWRLLFPMVWHHLHLPKMLYLAMPQVGCVLALGLIVHLLGRELRSRWLTWLAAVTLGSSSWFFVSTGWLAYFDSWLMLGLLIVSFVRMRWLVATACLLVPWIDERFVLALPLCLAVRLIYMERVEQRAWRETLIDAAILLGLCLPYATARIMLAGGGDEATAGYLARYVNLDRLAEVGAGRFVHGAWQGIRVGWLFVPAVLWLWRPAGRGRWLATMIVACGLTLAAGLIIAGDLSRSMAMVLPLTLVGIVLLARQQTDWLPRALPAAAALSLLLPATHVVTSFEDSIHWLPYELSQFNHPPEPLTPAYHNALGVECMNGGDAGEARRHFDTAIRLDDRYAPAYVNRAVMRFEAGDGTGAIADVDAAIAADPAYYEAWWLRGVIGEKRSPGAGTADLREALKLAPPDWRRRAATEEMLKEE